ncbi:MULTISPECIES: phage tail assembly protein [unclassified Bartonella]|uniref:phage tail assembly protein n=1 Tax=unclassified Bartonella TaxID=2645622 RepID=UPI00099940D1|nr:MULTISPECIES: phage tail assembly protein [unclassified Bartonella]AQX19642.1 Phage tail assembly chaperone protein, E, or 41 or 14 [Bartonella sp. WD16.2]OPB29529.1 Phage tail assembly chaperone protein, E, or 41 or 14 [Bartonella sp. WD12.1]
MTIKQNITHKLLFPINVEGKERTEITLRRPKVKDAEATDKTEGVEQTIIMISRLSGWPEEAVGELDVDDMENIGKKLAAFIKRRAT